MAAFEDLGVMPEIIRAIEEMGWSLPTPVQAEAIPLILGGGDVAAASETGSGKTGAFSLPIVQIVHETLREASTAGQRAHSAGGGPMLLSTEDRDSLMAVSGDGLTCQSRADKAWQGVRATRGVTSGRVYYEAQMLDDGLVRVGWSTAAASRDLGTDRNGFGYGGTGKKSHNRQFDTYGEPFGKGDVVGCCVDFDAALIHFSNNGVGLGVAFQLPPTLQSFALYPAVCVKNAEVRLNFGATPFCFSPPAGFSAAATAPPPSSSPSAAPLSQWKGPLAIVVEPARELAEQVEGEVSKFKKYLPPPRVTASLFVGGLPIQNNIRALQEGSHIIVATTGRIDDLLQSGKLDLSGVRFLVLDEADRLLDTGNQTCILNIVARLPPKRQVLLFSATLHSAEIRELSRRIQKFATWVDLKGKDFVPDTVRHGIVRVDPRADSSWRNACAGYRTDGVHSKDNLRQTGPEQLSDAVKVLKALILLRLIEARGIDQALVFVRTKIDADNLEDLLVHRGGGKRYTGKAEKGLENALSCVVLHGDRPPHERKQNLQAFKDGDVRFLICTDVAARGIDISGLPYVINMTLPDRSEDYIHRVGRTGRADAIGMAISLVSTVKEKVWYHTCPCRGRGCSNTRLTDEGGCTIWYDEQALLHEVEARLQMSVGVLEAPKYRLAEEGEADAAQYGKQRGDASSAATVERLQQRRPMLERLMQVEVSTQHSFLNLKHAFRRC